jgi:hypothetical protein
VVVVREQEEEKLSRIALEPVFISERLALKCVLRMVHGVLELSHLEKRDHNEPLESTCMPNQINAKGCGGL